VSDHPERPDDPFGHLPPELREMLEHLGGADAFGQMQQQMQAMFAGGGATGPVDWDLATRVALQLAADGDRSPSAEEQRRAGEALELAEHWLDATPLPAPPDAGRLVVGSRQSWVNAAVPALKPLVEPVARASTEAMARLAQEQLDELGGGDLPPEMAGIKDLLGLAGGIDIGQMMRPMGAALSGLQAGQVIGRLAGQLLGQYELGIPTAGRAEAHWLAVNVDEAFAGWDLDPMEVAIALALTEAAHRRLYHAVPWLEAHIESLVARFAAGTTVDADKLREVSEELMLGVDPEDPESLQQAMEQAAGLQLEPTAEQRRVLERLQGVVSLVGAWARHEVQRAVEGRLPSFGRIDEVLRRRRAERGDGEQLLSSLLGLDLKPRDETIGDRFVLAVEEARGPEGLRRALDHPENLPDAEEMADPARWLQRTDEDSDIPDDPSALFGELGEAPREGSADERRRDREDPGEGDAPRPGDDPSEGGSPQAGEHPGDEEGGDETGGDSGDDGSDGRPGGDS
jgi:putative hydrolase